jgi:hypothetical protein
MVMLEDGSRGRARGVCTGNMVTVAGKREASNHLSEVLMVPSALQFALSECHDGERRQCRGQECKPQDCDVKMREGRSSGRATKRAAPCLSAL